MKTTNVSQNVPQGKVNNFIILLPNGTAINQTTQLKRNGQLVKLSDCTAIAEFIKRIWCKETGSKNFTDWANQLNNSNEYEGAFTKYDALDNLSGLFQLNINGEHVHLYKFFEINLPFNDI